MKISLVNMPFGSLMRPSIGISLLKSKLEQMGYYCDNFYLNLRFPLYVGIESYMLVSDAPPTALIGELIFSQAAFGTKDDSMYLDQIKSYLKNTGNQSLNVDQLINIREQVEPFLEDCLTSIQWEKYDIIGFTSLFEQNVASLALARRIKEMWPNKHIVFGGANCEGIMGVTMLKSFPYIDAVCQGEGDISFPLYVSSLHKGDINRKIPGIVTRNNYSISGTSVKVLDDLPYPNYSDFFTQFDDIGYTDFLKPTILFETSRGCWWGEKSHCTFCGLNGSNIRFRSKSQGRALSELRFLFDLYGKYTNQFAAVDNILDYKYFNEFLPQLSKLNLNIDLFYETKANLKRHEIELLSNAGFSGIQPGIESLITDVLHRIKKGVNMLQNVRLLKWCREYGLIPEWNIIFGFPGENIEDYQRIASILPFLSHLQPPTGYGPFRLDRFSPYFDDPEQFGIVNVRPYSAYKHVYTTLNDQQLFNLAYYFEFDYAEPRNPTSYTEEMRLAIDRWREQTIKSEFFYKSLNDWVIIFDSRNDQIKIDKLTSWEADTYRLCDDISTTQKIHQKLIELGWSIDIKQVQAKIDQMVDRGWMLKEGNYCLALAISDMVYTHSLESQSILNDYSGLRKGVL